MRPTRAWLEGDDLLLRFNVMQGPGQDPLAPGRWVLTTGTGDLTGTSFTVIMAGGALPCNVTWWVRQAATMTDSFLKGTVIAGTGVTVTNGTFGGNMWAGASGTGDATESGAVVTGCP